MSRARWHRAGYTLLRGELRARRGAMVRIVLWSVVESLPSLLSGLVVAAAVDHFLARDIFVGLGVLAVLLAAAVVGAMAARQLYPWLAAVVEPVRDAFVTAVVDGAVAAATTAPGKPDTAGVARLTEQVQSVRNILFALLRTMRQIVFTFVAALAGLALLAPTAALVSGLLVTLSLALFALLLPGLAVRRKAVLLAEEDVARRAGAAFGGIRDAIACAGQDKAVGAVGEAVDGEVALTRALARVTAVRNLIVFVGGQLPLVVLLATAPWLLQRGYLTVGEMVGAATYLTVSLEPALRSIVGVVGTWGLDLAVSLARLGEGFAKPEPIEQGRAPIEDRYDLTVHGLTFSYGPSADPIVRELDFTVPEGGHLAVIGPSGAGKSTLASLLTRLLTPTHGTVRVGGTDIAQIHESHLRILMALIPQEAYVFAGSLRENLIYLAPHATERDLTRAAAVLRLQPVIDRLGGLDAQIGAGGAELSNGEKQLVALARVYLSPARIVILDEATSNLDPMTEARVETAFMRRQGTLIVIAHHISSARRASRILLLDGDSVHIGTHDELLRTSALYADLVGHWEISDSIPTSTAG
jgi:ABC-type multidrug transport system fused ATPase/permease subunit